MIDLAEAWQRFLDTLRPFLLHPVTVTLTLTAAAGVAVGVWAATAIEIIRAVTP